MSKSSPRKVQNVHVAGMTLCKDVGPQNKFASTFLPLSGHGVRAPPRVLRPPLPRLLCRQGVQEDPLAWVLQRGSFSEISVHLRSPSPHVSCRTNGLSHSHSIQGDTAAWHWVADYDNLTFKLGTQLCDAIEISLCLGERTCSSVMYLGCYPVLSRYSRSDLDLTTKKFVAVGLGRVGCIFWAVKICNKMFKHILQCLREMSRHDWITTLRSGHLAQVCNVLPCIFDVHISPFCGSLTCRWIS